MALKSKLSSCLTTGKRACLMRRSTRRRLAVDHLHLHQSGQELDMIEALGRALLRHLLVFAQEGGQLQSSSDDVRAGCAVPQPWPAPAASRAGVIGAPGGGDEGLGEVRIARQVEMHGPPLDARQQQVLDGIEADQSPLHRVLHRRRHLALREVLQQTQHLDVFALAARPEARFEEAAQRVEGRIELPAPQRRRLVQGSRLLLQQRQVVQRVSFRTQYDDGFARLI